MMRSSSNLMINLGLGLLIVFFSAACGNAQKNTADKGTDYTEQIIIDVRSQGEFAKGSVSNAVNIPLNALVARLAELPSDKQEKIVVFCQSGSRSGMAKQILENNGYTNVENAGGLHQMQAKLAASQKEKSKT
jgi:phage shock protein E